MRSRRRSSARWLVPLLLIIALLQVACGGTSPQAPESSSGDAGSPTTATAEPPKSLRFLVPAAPGGGWDQTARVMQQVLKEEGIIPGSIEVKNVGGAGGTIGLAELVTKERGNGDILMTMGLVMVGAIETNKSEVTLADATPIARLTAEYEVIVVPKDSPYKTLQDLIEAFKQNPGAIAWGGGSAGGTDHMLVGLIAKAVGVDPAKINYVPFAGGGEALAAILGGHVTAGVSGYGEFATQIESGELRALAISAPERVEGIDVPTLKEQGVDVELLNWRGLMAPPDITEEERAALLAAIDRLHKSDGWQRVLKERQWDDVYLAGDEFEAFLKEEIQRVQGVLRDIGLVQ
ncbi:MAG TPA: tripartite tricarboxylate transporter substrate binding protein [Calditerricola sp.]